MQEFEKSVKQDGRISLQREGELDGILSVRYTNDKITDVIGCHQQANNGCHQQANIDRL